eukprot:TRINITY_DN21602_c0_g3_i1.p1 TRINITY_DN21602_c0_g3~~TRINITY_DN21602_c0_g3_i1.p1  ORF type:complete len:743 (-),score=82.58 TRINITY_DN21602_c0_g3_i1:129-2357(-)
MDWNPGASSIYFGGCHNGNNQKFYFKVNPYDGHEVSKNPYIQVGSKQDAKCMEEEEGNTVRMNDCSRSNGQKIYLEDERLRLYWRPNICMDYDPGTFDVKGFPCHNANNQKWYFDAEQRIHSRYDDKCVDYNFGNGNIYMSGCHGGLNQKFFFKTLPTPAPTPRPTPPTPIPTAYPTQAPTMPYGTFRIGNGQNKRVMQVKGYGSNRVVFTYWRYNVAYQSWTLTDNGKKLRCPSMNMGDKCVEVSSSGDVTMELCEYNNRQEFWWDDQDRLRDYLGRCGDYKSGNGDVVMYFGNCHGGDNQKLHFKAYPIGDSNFNFEVTRMMASNLENDEEKCLDWDYSGSRITVGGCHGGFNQQWYVENGQLKTLLDSGSCATYLGDRQGVEMRPCSAAQDINQQWRFRYGKIQSSQAYSCIWNYNGVATSYYCQARTGYYFSLKVPASKVVKPIPAPAAYTRRETSGPDRTVTVCDRGQYVIGGGCSADGGSWVFEINAPLGDTAWVCQGHGMNKRTWAICSDVKPSVNTNEGNDWVDVHCDAGQKILGGGCIAYGGYYATAIPRPQNYYTCGGHGGRKKAFAICSSSFNPVIESAEGGDWAGVSCPAGSKILGGGCDAFTAPNKMQINAPDTDDHWLCGGHGSSKRVYAVCLQALGAGYLTKDDTNIMGPDDDAMCQTEMENSRCGAGGTEDAAIPDCEAKCDARADCFGYVTHPWGANMKTYFSSASCEVSRSNFKWHSKKGFVPR